MARTAAVKPKRSSPAKKTRATAKAGANTGVTPSARDSLQLAAQHLAAGKPEPALAAALDAWRATRAVAIARAIDGIGKRVIRRPLGSGTLEGMNKRWHAVAEAKDPLDVPRLLAALANSWATSVPKRIEALASFPPDPRVATGLATFLGTAPYKTAGSNVAYDAARTQVLEYADERVLEALAPWAGRASIAELIEKVRAAASPGRELTADEQEAVGALDRALAGSRSGEELLAAICAAPADDGPRAVYADWLLEQGDPHGELINLQLRAARDPLPEDARARERELIEKLGAKLGRPFARVTRAERTISRGFVSKVVIEPKNGRSLATAVAAPEWSVLEEIEIAQPFLVMHDTFCSPAFAHLRVLRGASIEMVRALLLGPPRAVEVLTIASFHAHKTEALLADPQPWSSLPALHTIGFTFRSLEPVSLAPLWHQPVAAQLRTLEVPDTGISDEWLAALAPTPITELRILAGAPSPPTHRYRRMSRAAEWRSEPPAT